MLSYRLAKPFLVNIAMLTKVALTVNTDKFRQFLIM